MTKDDVSNADKLMAWFCESCPLCRQARKTQRGLAFQLVQKIETKVCPFCRAYAKVHHRPAHQQMPKS